MARQSYTELRLLSGLVLAASLDLGARADHYPPERVGSASSC